VSEPNGHPEELLREVIGEELIERLAHASREYNVTIALSITPLDDDEEGD